MGRFEEFLAGFPRPATENETKMSWGSCRTFPGFMIHRMYILLTRPKQAIREFGAGDYKTPFLFFLFFAVIMAFLQSLASHLQLAVITYNFLMSSGQPTGFDTVIPMTITAWSFIQGILTIILLAFLLLLVSLIVLSAGIWSVTGTMSWNPAFTISAWCLPVPLLLYTILACIQIPRLLDSVSVVLGLACAAAGVIYMVIIAGYGITALTKAPGVSAGIMVFFWAVIAILLIGFAPFLIIIPAEDILSSSISQI